MRTRLAPLAAAAMLAVGALALTPGSALMTYTTLVTQANLSGPSTIPAITTTGPTSGVTASVTIPSGTTNANFRLTSTNWPTGTGDGIEWAMDRNDLDGNGWKEVTTGFTPEGARDRQGNMPGIYYQPGGQINGVVQATNHAIDLRIRYRIVGTVRIGIEREFLP